MKRWITPMLLTVLICSGRAENTYTIEADLTEMTGNASVVSNLAVGALTLNGQSITSWSQAQSVRNMGGVIYDTDFASDPFVGESWSCQGAIWWANHSIEMSPYVSTECSLIYSNATVMQHAPYTLSTKMSKPFPYGCGRLSVYDAAGNVLVYRPDFGRLTTDLTHWTGAWSRIVILGNPMQGHPNSCIGIDHFTISRDSAVEVEKVFSQQLETEDLNVTGSLDVNSIDVSTISGVHLITSPQNDSLSTPSNLTISAADARSAMPVYPLRTSKGGALQLKSGMGSSVYYGRENDEAEDGGELVLETGAGGDISYGSHGEAGDGGDLIIRLGAGGSGSDPEYGGDGGSIIVQPGQGGAGQLASGVDGAIYLDGATHIGGDLNMQGHAISNASFAGDGTHLININASALEGKIGASQLEDDSVSVDSLNTDEIDDRYLNRSGDTMTGSLGVGTISNLVSLKFANSSVVVGRDASAVGGIGVGCEAQGAYNGLAVGYQAVGWCGGLAVGYQAKGGYSGMAVGYQAQGSSFNMALGRSAMAIEGTHRIALGSGVQNKIDETTQVRGSLYLDGATGIYYRTTFGEGAWVPFVSGGGGSSDEAVLRTGDTMTGALVVDAAEEETNLVVNGWTLLTAIPPQGGLSMGIFTNGLSE